jgi:hypothetical protein
MNDDQLRSELERRSQAGSPDANLASAVFAPATPVRSVPSKLGRLAPAAGLLTVGVVFVLFAVSLPNRGPSASATPGSTGVVPRVFSCASPTEREYEPVVVNATDLDISCTFVSPGPLHAGLSVPQRPLVINPDGDQSMLQVDWFGSPCDAAAEFTLSRDYEALRLDTRLPVVE